MNIVTRTVIACAALALSVVPTFAESAYVCRSYGKQQFFARNTERRAARHESDPVTFVRLVFFTKNGEGTMDIQHVTRSGRTFSRGEQYPVNTLEPTKHGLIWKGFYDRDPRVFMVGTVRYDRRDTYYTEQRFDRGKLAWAAAFKCVPEGE